MHHPTDLGRLGNPWVDFWGCWGPVLQHASPVKDLWCFGCRTCTISATEWRILKPPLFRNPAASFFEFALRGCHIPITLWVMYLESKYPLFSVKKFRSSKQTALENQLVKSAQTHWWDWLQRLLTSIYNRTCSFETGIILSSLSSEILSVRKGRRVNQAAVRCVVQVAGELGLPSLRWGWIPPPRSYWPNNLLLLPKPMLLILRDLG